jgi:hypothetical protein
MGEEQTRLDVFFIQAPVDRHVDGFFHQIDNSFSALDASSLRALERLPNFREPLSSIWFG